MVQKIAYQGEPGANSNIACAQMFPELESVPCASFEDTLELVSSGEAALAMIPIENSIAGRGADIHILLPQSSSRNGSLHTKVAGLWPFCSMFMTVPGYFNLTAL